MKYNIIVTHCKDCGKELYFIYSPEIPEEILMRKISGRRCDHCREIRKREKLEEGKLLQDYYNILIKQ